ncbi:hypothetical protein PRIPAC_97630, partial [Pristionchus pacificus]
FRIFLSLLPSAMGSKVVAVETKRPEMAEKDRSPSKGSCMESFARFPVYITCICANAIFQGMIVNGFISTSISSIEKRFNLSSTKSGIFSATYDVAVAVMLIPLSIYSKRINKSKVIGVGMILVGLGSLCIVIPQFSEGNYSVGSLQSDHCDPTRDDSCMEQPVSDWAFPILLASQLLVGVGAAPLFTYGYSCIDEFDAHKRTGKNMALFMGVSTLGPAVGFIGGGYLLKLWGDIGKTDYRELGVVGTQDSRWYGAWWIGFVIAGIGCILAAIPMCFFPRKLYDTEERKKDDVALTHKKLDVDYSGDKWEYFKTFQLFLYNRTCMSLIAMQTFESLVMNGYITFIPKLFENLFGYSSSWSAMLTGIIVVPMGVLGNCIGALLAGKTSHSFTSMMKTTIVLNLIVVACSSVLFLRCDERPIAGINRGWSNSSIGTTCTANCECDRIFNPVCDKRSGVSFFSPCHAGCQRPLDHLTALDWSGCTCPDSSHVSKGWCTVDCNITQVMFFTIFAIMAATIFSGGPLLQNASLRVVSFDHRDQFICFGWMWMRVFGSIPGAVVFGMLIDTTCLHWMKDCGDSQKCVVYDTTKLSLYTFLFTIITKLAVLLAQISAWKSYVPIEGCDEEEEEKTQNEA